jgi:hypothetical protein
VRRGGKQAFFARSARANSKGPAAAGLQRLIRSLMNASSYLPARNQNCAKPYCKA